MSERNSNSLAIRILKSKETAKAGTKTIFWIAAVENEGLWRGQDGPLLSVGAAAASRFRNEIRRAHGSACSGYSDGTGRRSRGGRRIRFESAVLFSVEGDERVRPRPVGRSSDIGAEKNRGAADPCDVG